MIKIRYRDIPWEEARKCMAGSDSPENRKRWEENIRGKVFSLNDITAVESHPLFRCKGSVFESRGGAVLCSHIAEIGD